MFKEQKGVTLIALVITIIVLLILAGVSIAMLTGDNGILTNASEAKKESLQKEAIEKINIALNSIKTEALAQRVKSTTFDPTSEAGIAILNDADVTGIDTTKDTMYAIDDETAGTIKITYTNTTEDITVEGSIVFADAASNGTITAAAVQE